MPWISSILSTCPITAVAQAEVELNNLKGFAKFTKKGENAQKSLHERLQNYKKVVTGRQAEQIGHSKNRGVR